MKDFSKITAQIEEQIRKKNHHVTAMYKVSFEAGKKAAIEGDEKLRKLFDELGVNPTEWARWKLGIE